MITAGEMTVFWRGDPVAVHTLLSGRFGEVQVPSHLEGLVRKPTTYRSPTNCSARSATTKPRRGSEPWTIRRWSG